MTTKTMLQLAHWPLMLLLHLVQREAPLWAIGKTILSVTK